MKTRLGFAILLSLPLFAWTNEATAGLVWRNHTTATVKGITAFFMTDTEPASVGVPNDKGWGLVVVSVKSEVIQRVLYDPMRKINFGYSLRLEAIEGSTKIRATVEPLDLVFFVRLAENLGGAKEAALKSEQLSRYPKPQIVEDGDLFSLEIAVNRETGVKLLDFIMVSKDPLKIEQFRADQEPARDFSLDDVHLVIKQSRLLVDGQPVGRSVGVGLSGSVLYFVMPGRGRFLVSFRPHERYAFQKTGTILHNKMIFSMDGIEFQWISKEPILGRGGKWNLWVLHQPDVQREATEWKFVATGL